MKKYHLRPLTFAILIAAIGLCVSSPAVSQKKSKPRTTQKKSSSTKRPVVSRPVKITTVEGYIRKEFILYPSGAATLNSYCGEDEDNINASGDIVTTRSYQLIRSYEGTWLLDWTVRGSSIKYYYYYIKVGGENYFMFYKSNTLFEGYHNFWNSINGINAEVKTL